MVTEVVSLIEDCEVLENISTELQGTPLTMSGKYNGTSPSVRRDKFPDSSSTERIQAGADLIKQQQIRSSCQSTGQL